MDIYVKTAYNLPEELKDKEICYNWKRGSKSANKGKSENVWVEGGIAMFGSNISLKCTLFRVSKTKKFEPKKIIFEIKIVESSSAKAGTPAKVKTKDYGTVEFDLASYGEAGKYEAVTFPINLKSKPKKPKKKKGETDDDEGLRKIKEPSMKLDITTAWTHINKKKLVEGGVSGKDKVEVGGISYGLETDPNAHSEGDDGTTAGDLSENEDKSDSDSDKEDDEPSDDPPSVSKETQDSGSQISSNGTIRSSVGTSSLGSIPALAISSGEVDKLKRDLGDEKKRRAEVERELEKLKLELERSKQDLNIERGKAKEIKEELNRVKETSNGVSSQLATSGKGDETLRKKIKELEGKLDEKAQELSRIIKGNKSSTSSNSVSTIVPTPAASSEETESLKRRLKEIEREREEDQILTNLIYCMTPEYDKKSGVQISAAELSRKLIEWKVLEDPPNDRVLRKVLTHFEKQTKSQAAAYRDYSPEVLFGWLSYGCMLHEQLEQEVGTAEAPNSGDLPMKGIHIRSEDVAFKSRTGKVMIGARQVDEEDPVACFFYDLETLLFEIYSVLIRRYCERLEANAIPVILGSGQARNKGAKILNQQDKSGSISSSGSSIQEGSSNAADGSDFSVMLSEALNLTRRHRIFGSIKQQFFSQLFWYISVKLCNMTFRRKDLCNAGTGLQLKLGLSLVGEWIAKVVGKEDKDMLSKVTRDQLEPLVELAGVLVVDPRVFEDASNFGSVFPRLTAAQIKSVLEKFQIDQYTPKPVSPEVLKQLGDKAKVDKSAGVVEFDENTYLSATRVPPPKK